jgi:hypothetical protein
LALKAIAEFSQDRWARAASTPPASHLPCGSDSTKFTTPTQSSLCTVEDFALLVAIFERLELQSSVILREFALAFRIHCRGRVEWFSSFKNDNCKMNISGFLHPGPCKQRVHAEVMTFPRVRALPACRAGILSRPAAPRTPDGAKATQNNQIVLGESSGIELPSNPFADTVQTAQRRARQCLGASSICSRRT